MQLDLIARVGAASAALALSTLSASAQDAVAQFYKDKTLTFVSGSAVGGGIDTYTRLVARHLSRYVPGNPRVVPQNMPGAGGITAAAHTYASAPKDGTQITMVLAGAIMDPLFGAGPRRYDPTRFNFIGNVNHEMQVCIARSDAPVKTFSDAFKTELVVGGSGPGATITDFPIFLRNFVGARIKFVGGYPGSREVSLAVQKGEIQGVCGLAWSSAILQFPEAVNPGAAFRVLVQEDVKGIPVLDKIGVPLVTDFVKSAEDRPVLELFYSQGSINRAVIAPPEVPADRVAALRRALSQTLKDSELLSEAGKMKTDVEPMTGEDVQKLVASIYAAPPAVIDRMKKALEGTK